MESGRYGGSNTCRVVAHCDYVYLRRVGRAKIVSLMKIVPCKEYADSFLDGNLYCNTVRYFRDRGYDEFEGAAFIHPDTLRIGSHTIPQADLAGPVKYGCTKSPTSMSSACFPGECPRWATTRF